MANVKNITELPMAESAEGLNLIVNDGGVAKQIAASEVGAQADWTETDESSPAFIKNKPSRELMYEWNFSADDDVLELYVNVNDDLSWLTQKQDNVDFDIVAEVYGYEYYYTEGEGESDCTALEDVYTISSVQASDCFINMPDYNFPSFAHKEVLNGMMGSHETSIQIKIDDKTYKNIWLCPWINIYIVNGTHFDEDYSPTSVETGGFIGLYAENPFKSIRIYKVTK